MADYSLTFGWLRPKLTWTHRRLMQAWFWQVDLGISLVLHNNTKNWWNSASWSLKISHCFCIFLFLFWFFFYFFILFFFLQSSNLIWRTQDGKKKKKRNLTFFWTQQAQKKKNPHELKNMHIYNVDGRFQRRASFIRRTELVASWIF